jgi:O-acetyl-ADP-ribose deacetylase (regulator of RNase III)
MIVVIGDATIETQQGDISQARVDAVVNAANNHLWMGSGVAGAIKRAGGIEIEREAVAQGPIEVGEAVVTSGGTLPAKYVIHAAAMGQDLRTDRSKISKSTRNALHRAKDIEAESIAFPALGTGVGGFPPEEAAQAMITECIAFIKSGVAPSLKKIIFVLFSSDALASFEKQLHGRD